jgi:uncharacterized membrane protein
MNEIIKNPLFLVSVFIVLVFVISFTIYKIDNEEPDESNMSKFRRCVLPSILVGIIVVLLLYFVDIPRKKDVYLEENFWD